MPQHGSSGHRLALTLSTLVALAASGVAWALPTVDPSVPARHETDPVILSGAQLDGWAVSSEFTFKLPLTDLKDCQSFNEKCNHNNYADPEVAVAPQQGTPIDRFLGYKWDAGQKAWRQIPFQVDEMFTRYLDNAASGFSVYSGEDKHTTYAFDREGFRYRTSDPADPCHAIPDSPAAKDPVRGLDNDDELVFMNADAGPKAPQDAHFPPGVEQAREVVITDPQTGAQSYVYVMMTTAASGKKPAFTKDNGYVRYIRDANADTFLFSESSYEGYGNAPTGPYYDEAADQCVANGNKRRRPWDGTWITTPRYKFRYDGRWLLTKLMVSNDGGQTYGGDMVDRWKARAFQQDPESETPCCGYEEEDTNWGGSSTLLGERVGPVRAIRETWGADSGTNVIRRETFYHSEVRQKSYLRVHVIPPLDGIYAQWDFNAGRVTKYFNPNRPNGVAVDGRNDEVFGNLDDPCTAHYDQNDTGEYTATYRDAYNALSLCPPMLGIEQTDEIGCPPLNCHQSIDIADPTFTGTMNASLEWHEVTGPAGTLIDRTTIDKVTDLTPGGAAQSMAAVPYYRDDSCFDDGTGSDPGPKLRPRDGMLSEERLPDGTKRTCWRGTPAVPDGDKRFFQGDIGTHGLHILLIADSDNARQTVPLTEIVAEQRLVMLPPSRGQKNFGEQYGRHFEKPLVPVVSGWGPADSDAPEGPPAGGGGTDPGKGGGTGGGPQQAQDPYPGSTAPPATVPATTKPEAMEAGVLGKTASSRCLSGSQPVSSRGVGKLRLGKAPSRALRLSGRPAQGLAGVLGWCVKGGGKVVAAFSKKGAVTLVASTAPGSVLRGIRVGSSFGTAKKRLGLRRLAAGIYRSKTGALVLVRGKRVRGLGVAQRSLGVRAVKRYLAAIDR